MVLINIAPMRKKLLLFILFSSFSSTCGYSQVLISLLLGDKLNSDKIEFGLDGGLALNSLTNLDDVKMSKTFHLGFYFDIKMKNNWLLHTGVIVKSQMGAKNIPYYMDDTELNSLFANATATRKLNYFDIPIYAKYKFYKQFYAEAGPQIGLLYKAKDYFKTTNEAGREITATNNIKDYYKKIDAGLGFGLGYKLMKGKGINVGARYYLGLLNIAKDDWAEQKNRVLYFYAGIPIGAGKKNKPTK